MSADCRDLIARIFQADPDKRATVEDIRRHPWFLRNLPPELAVHALHIGLGYLISICYGSLQLCSTPAATVPGQPADLLAARHAGKPW